MMSGAFRENCGHIPSTKEIDNRPDKDTGGNGGKEQMPGIVGGHFISLGKKFVHKRRPAAGMADNKHRLFDFHITKPGEKNPVEKKGDGFNYGKNNKNHYHHRTMEKITACAEHFPADSDPV
jgi:hypothetical protein